MKFCQLVTFHHKIPEAIRNLCKTVIKGDSNANYGIPYVHIWQTVSTVYLTSVVFQLSLSALGIIGNKTEIVSLLRYFHLPTEMQRSVGNCY